MVFCRLDGGHHHQPEGVLRGCPHLCQAGASCWLAFCWSQAAPPPPHCFDLGMNGAACNAASRRGMHSSTATQCSGRSTFETSGVPSVSAVEPKRGHHRFVSIQLVAATSRLIRLAVAHTVVSWLVVVCRRASSQLQSPPMPLRPPSGRPCCARTQARRRCFLMAGLDLCHDGTAMYMPLDIAVPLQSLFTSRWRCSGTDPTHAQLQQLKVPGMCLFLVCPAAHG